MKSVRPNINEPTVVLVLCLAALSCRVSDVFVAQGNSASTRTPTRPRPTFTLFAQLVPEEPTNTPPPTQPPPTPRPPTSTRAPTRIPTATRPPPPVPLPPTPDPQGSYYYKYRIRACVPGDNTRIEGVVINNGSPVNGITLRVTADPDGPSVDQKVTGIDPSDPSHIDPSLAGKYRLGIAEGARTPGNWWVFIVNANGDAETAKVFLHTDEWAGCNIATVDWVH